MGDLLCIWSAAHTECEYCMGTGGGGGGGGGRVCVTKYPVDGEHVTGRQDSQLVPLLVQCRIFAGSDNILGRFEPLSSIELNCII